MLQFLTPVRALTFVRWLSGTGAGGRAPLRVDQLSGRFVADPQANGDCWQTETRITFPGVTLSYHDEAWRDAHRKDKAYRWHETDNDHDWHHGYWEKALHGLSVDSISRRDEGAAGNGGAFFIWGLGFAGLARPSCPGRCSAYSPVP
jgi:hypothetical protein